MRRERTKDEWSSAVRTPGRDSVGGKRVSVAGLVARFTIAGVLVMAALATGLALLARQAGTDKAVESAEQVSWVTARGIAEPKLTPEVVAGDPAALTEFNEAMQSYVLRGSLVRVKVWTADGTIIYSDESRLIGQTFPLGEEEVEALHSGLTDSEISDLSAPENVYEQSFGKLLEVYNGVTATDGEKLLFETYFRYDAVVTAGQAEWRTYAPVALGALLLLELVQIPFAWSLARRLQRQQQDRQRLLQHAVDASDAERRRIAGDLHDGVVQDLTGLTYALDAARLGPTDPARDAELIRTTASGLRNGIHDLRSLLVDIYPPNLTEEGLPASLTELAGRLERAGVSVELDLEGADDLPPQTAAVLYRSAQEILRNVTAHSHAQQVLISATADSAVATLVVDDDGRGFDPADLERQLAGGHLGLRSLGDLVAEAGGTLIVRSAPSQGTRAEVSVPVG
jgi:two-component system, NarL family, sensor kinase